MQDKGKSTYNEVFKSTLLFAFVRAFQMLIGIVRTKLVAIILGPSGVGLILIYDKTVELIKKGAGLGISQSALRDISVARNSGNKEQFSSVYIATRRVVLFTGFLGMFITIGLSPWLSKWTCGDNEHIMAYACLSLATLFTIITEVQMSILKGVRAQRQLACSSIAGALSGLLFSVPIFYFLGKAGIVPAIIIHALVLFFVTNFFVKKIEYQPQAQTFSTTVTLASPMVKVGVILVFVGMLDSLFAVLLSSFLRKQGGFEVVGLYQAGYTIMSSYFGIIVSSMAMDYYPRISAVHNQNEKVADEFNKQVKIGMMFVFPLSVLFVFFAPLIINILYTEEFSTVVFFADLAIFGAILHVIAECLRIILVAKQIAKTYAVTSVLLKGFFLPMYLYLFQVSGLYGLGLAFALDSLIQVVVYSLMMHFKYRIHLDRESLIMTLMAVVAAIIARYVRELSILWMRYVIGLCLISISLIITDRLFRRFLGKSLLNTCLSILKKK